MSEEVFTIEGFDGQRKAHGEISVNGAKNDIVQALAASVLFEGDISFSNVPDIEDKKKMLDILSDLGSIISDKGREVTVNTSNIKHTKISPEISKMMRASIILIGPILGRLGEVSFPHPGGCVIGERPIDFFLEGLTKMGAEVSEDNHFYKLVAPDGLIGAEIFFKNPSVTATETLMMAAIFAKGKTVLKNCPTEPEITNLANFLVESGANISGIGTNTLVIEGQKDLLKNKNTYKVLPDRIEAGSFIILGALVGNIRVTNCDPRHVESLINFLRISGVEIEVGEAYVEVKNVSSGLKPISIKTHEYPGFPTDLQAPMAVFMTQTNGVSHIFETIYEGRLSYLETLNQMGAKTIVLNPHEASVEGKTPLKGRMVKSPDLRAGLAYVLAGIVANGRTVVHNVHYIDRGYESIENRLRGLGIDIKREKI